MQGIWNFLQASHRQFQKLKLSVRKAIFFSVALHIAVMLLLLLVDKMNPKPIEVSTIDIDYSEIDTAKLKKAEEILDRQIVQQDEKSVNETEPDKAKFLSAKNQDVKKETVSQNRGEFRNANKAQAQGAKQEQKTAENTKQDKNANPLRGDESKSKNGADKKISLLKNLSRPYDPTGMFEKVEKQQ
jgi:hypothetical protein